MEFFLAIPVGLSLAAACGLRVFLPLLVLGVAARLGVVEPSANLAWVASWPALAALGTAAVVEVAGYYIPWVDHALDALATPLAAAGGALAAMVTMLPADSALAGWSAWAPVLATGAGGALTASTVQLTTVAARAASTLTTGGLANPIVSTVENIGATILSIMSIIAPFVGLMLLLCAFLLARRWFFRRSPAGHKHGIGPIPAPPAPAFARATRRKPLLFRALGLVALLAPWRWWSRRPWRRQPAVMA